MCEDTDKVVKDSIKKDVKIIVSNGVDKNTNRLAIEYSRKYKGVHAGLGIYPIEALKMSKREIDEEISFIEENSENIIAIGEVGLDLKESSDLEGQKKVFGRLIELSNKIDKPLIVHSRKAEKECIDFLKERGAKKVVMHCFSGSMNLVDHIIENGWSLSIPANVVFSEHFQKVVNRVPIENILCETDSPFLHPEKERNNIPGNVTYSYKKIAEIKSLKIEEVEKIIEKNFKKLFLNKN